VVARPYVVVSSAEERQVGRPEGRAKGEEEES